MSIYICIYFIRIVRTYVSNNAVGNSSFLNTLSVAEIMVIDQVGLCMDLNVSPIIGLVPKSDRYAKYQQIRRY